MQNLRELKEEFRNKSSHSIENGGFLAKEPPEDFVAMVDNQWNWLESAISSHLQEIEKKIEKKKSQPIIQNRTKNLNRKSRVENYNQGLDTALSIIRNK